MCTRNNCFVDVQPPARILISSTRQVVLPLGPTSLIKWGSLMKLACLTSTGILCGLDKVFLFLTECTAFKAGVYRINT